MKRTTDSEAPNKTIALLRRMAAEKRETKREMRQAFATDPDIQRIIEELDTHNAQREHQSV